MPAPEHSHRGEPRHLQWLRPATARGAAIAAVAGATALGGAVVAASTLVGPDTGRSLPRAEVRASTMPASVHGGQARTVSDRASTTHRSAVRGGAASPGAAPTSEQSTSDGHRLSLPEVTPSTPNAATITATIGVSGPVGGAGSGTSSQSAPGGSTAKHRSAAAGSDGGGSHGGRHHSGGSSSPSPTPPPVLPELPTPSLPTVSISLSGVGQ